MKKKLAEMKVKNAQVRPSTLDEELKRLPSMQQQQVRACLEASKRKSTCGMKFSDEWALECIIMRMKSPRLYEHLRKQKTLVLPGRTCLRTYTRAYRGGFGLNINMFRCLAEKTKTIDNSMCHGGLLIDEIKLSEHLSVGQGGKLEGFVDLADYTTEKEKHLMCDHGLVLLFQPFGGKWHQILGVFGSRSNVKAEMLARIIVDAILMTEKAGLFIDFVTCDAAAWNRRMWKIFGIKATSTKVVCKTEHPADPSRKLHFISDFPHLVKCSRNNMLIAGFRTPEGRVLVEHIEEAWKCDNKSLTPLRAMPRVTKPVLHPNGFEKMSVSHAIRLYSDEVVRGLYLYKQEVEGRFGTTTATECFVKKMRDLISVMTSRRSKDALRPGSRKEAVLQEFLDYLNTWEASAGTQGQGFLSRSTAEGLRVTLSSTLSLLDYVTGELGYRYLLTSRLSQDPIENLFGILRQMSGCNDHPTPSQFLVSVNCLTFANLAKSPTGGNVTGSTLRSLLNPSNAQDAQRRVDDLLDLGNLQEAKATLDACGIVTDQLSLTRERSDSRLVFYIAGIAKLASESGSTGRRNMCPANARLQTPREADEPTRRRIAH
ncbi:uncharacterized protein ISCGN_002918 [Ixodes scapularis]